MPANGRSWGFNVSEGGDLNTETGEISPDRGNHAIRVTGAGRTHPAIPRRVRCLVRHLGPRSSPPWSAGPTPTWRRSRPPARITTRSAARAPHDRSLGGEIFCSEGAGVFTPRRWSRQAGVRLGRPGSWLFHVAPGAVGE